jgi:hypothetical protein
VKIVDMEWSGGHIDQTGRWSSAQFDWNGSFSEAGHVKVGAGWGTRIAREDVVRRLPGELHLFRQVGDGRRRRHKFGFVDRSGRR